MIMNYIDVMPDDSVRACLSYEQPDEGPPSPQWKSQAQGTVIPVDSPVSWAGPTPTCTLYWKEGAYVWVDEQTLADGIAAAVAKCYVDIDEIYTLAIGNRQAEYTDAEVDARAVVAGAAATENVSSFARYNPTGAAQTDLWAAEQIIARADAFRSAQIAMRAQRFDSQAAMRACVTPAALAQVVYLWDQFIAGLRAQLGL